MSLSLHGLRKRYPTLDLDLDLDVADGELATLLGPSGCGKTTALRLIAGFLQPDAGSVIIDGRDVSALAPEERGVGIVFQDYALFPHMDVAANVAFGPRMRGWPRREIDGRVEELLALVGLAGYGRRKVDELSGGEQQRVALARALAPRPRLLLLDEPLSALDRGLRESLRREIRRVQRGLGITAVYVTHDQEEALALSDRVIVINGGRVAQAGGPREVYARPASLFVAGFVGKSNRVAGTIASRGESELEVATAWGLFRCPGPPAGRVGDAVSVLFRPEGCRIAAAGGRPPHNSLVAVVDSVEYVGEGSLVRVRADGCELLVKTGDDEPPAPGDRVTLVAAPSACWALPGAPDT
jgi:ABC-type Fe3+/spermidine/putrescine transport system ATPase subunit